MQRGEGQETPWLSEEPRWLEAAQIPEWLEETRRPVRSALHAARAGYRVRCNSVHPAFVDTPMLGAVLAATSERGKLERAIPLGRLGDADEIADLVLYLASDESRFVTGAELVIDGGLSAR